MIVILPIGKSYYENLINLQSLDEDLQIALQDRDPTLIARALLKLEPTNRICGLS